MALRKETLETKKRILAVCVRLFMQQGYHATTISQIVKEAGVSVSSFQNIFRAKDGILSELIEFMFASQFGAAANLVGENASPVYVYAVETAIQLALTEENENIRDIYLEAYSLPETSEYLYEHTAAELHKIFGSYLPECSLSDFYDLEIGTAGIMRGYMSKRCSVHFTFERKLQCFLELTLRAYHVPDAEREEVQTFIQGQDISALADAVLQKLFTALEMQFSLQLPADEVER